MAKPPKAPVELSDAVCERILERIMEGESLREICADADMPSRTAVFKRLAKDEDFQAQYAAAHLIQSDSDADDVVAEARKANAENASAVKVLVSALQWRAEKRNPKKYGAKADVNLGGGLRIEIVDFADGE